MLCDQCSLRSSFRLIFFLPHSSVFLPDLKPLDMAHKFSTRRKYNIVTPILKQLHNIEACALTPLALQAASVYSFDGMFP